MTHHRKRFDALVHGDLFFLDPDKGQIAVSLGVTLQPDETVQIHYVLPGDPGCYRQTVLAAHQTIVLVKPPKSALKELKALNGLIGA